MQRRTFLGSCIAAVAGILSVALGIQAKPRTIGFDPGSPEGDWQIHAWMGPGWYAEVVKVRDTFVTREFRHRVLTLKCGPLGTKHALRVILEPGTEGDVRAALNTMSRYLQNKGAEGVAWAYWLAETNSDVRRLFNNFAIVLDFGLRREQVREGYLKMIDEMLTTPVGCVVVTAWIAKHGPVTPLPACTTGTGLRGPFLDPETDPRRHDIMNRIRTFVEARA